MCVCEAHTKVFNTSQRNTFGDPMSAEIWKLDVSSETVLAITSTLFPESAYVERLGTQVFIYDEKV